MKNKGFEFPRAYSIKEGWTLNGNKWLPLYTLKYTYPSDGTEWRNPPVTCLEFSSDDEHGFGKPYVWFDNNT